VHANLKMFMLAAVLIFACLLGVAGGVAFAVGCSKKQRLLRRYGAIAVILSLLVLGVGGVYGSVKVFQRIRSRGSQ